MMDLTSDELAKQIAQIQEDREAERAKRHQLNNSLSKALLSISEDLNRHEDHFAKIQDIVDRVVAIDHIVRGVDGENGLRGDMRYIKDAVNGIKVRVALISAGFAIIGTIIVQWMMHVLKIG